MPSVNKRDEEILSFFSNTPILWQLHIIKYKHLIYAYIKKDGECKMSRQNAPIISVREALHRQDTDPWTIFIDIRDYDDYSLGHIPKAVNIPLWKFEYGNHMLNNSYKYIIYCEHGGTSMQLAIQLNHKGLHAETLAGGYFSYKQYVTTHRY